MKIQCSCGAKYQFDVAPDMAGGPVHFVCPACGLDASEYVTGLVRQELGLTGQARPEALSTRTFAPSETGVPASGSDASGQGSAAPRLRIHLPTSGAAESAPSAASETPSFCVRHPAESTTDKCYICSKPICPRCLELFGYVCGPLCKAKAESHGINVPVYEGQRNIVEARLWHNVSRVVMAVSVVLVALLGFWFWYAWFGQEPKTVFSVRFPLPAYSGKSVICGKDQIVFLHGDTLARYDLVQKKEVWSRQLLDREYIDAKAAKLHKEMQERIVRLQQDGAEFIPKLPTLEKMKARAEIGAAAALELRAQGQNIWVAQPEKLVRYDWDSGKPLKEILLRPGLAGMMPRGGEFLLVETDLGKPVVTHVDLTTCESRTEEIGGQAAPVLAAALNNASSGANSGGGGPGRGTSSQEMAGLPQGMPGKDAGKPMDPARVAAQAQHLSLPARIALPATLSINRNQERALSEMDDAQHASNPSTPPPESEGTLSLIPTKTGFIQFSVKLLESRFTERSAMRPAPVKSALDGPVSVGNSGQVANEILNEMQRERGGDKVLEDASRYRVNFRRPEAPEAWSGEVVGSPTLFPLQTVDVLSANKSIIVFDKNNKKLWESTLNYNITEGMATLDEQDATYGQGPCVEHEGSLYVYDAGVLTAFDLATGTARWRLPSVGIVGLFFDDRGMIYVNTTTASPESLKYSRQIDISSPNGPVVLKLDAKTGKQLWREELHSLVNYVSGKYIYTVTSYAPDEDDEDNTTDDRSPPYLRIKRINPRNGTVIWEHFQQRAPLDVQFDKNTIRLVFKKEVQVLRFLAL